MKNVQDCKDCWGTGKHDAAPRSGRRWTVCRTCGGTGQIVTTTTQAREERRFELIKAALTGALAAPSLGFNGATEDQTRAVNDYGRIAVEIADAVLARLDAEKEKSNED